MVTDNVVQWNCRGLLKNLDDIYELLSQHQISIMCLQETHLRTNQTNFLKNYSVFRKDRDGCMHPSGGVAIIVQKSVACQFLPLQTSLEAVAIRAIIFNKLVTVCSLYIPPDHGLSSMEFETLVDQLPEPYLLVGDCNAHHPLWGSARTDARGRLVEKFLLSSGACILNKKDPTYYNTTHATYSCIDLAIASPVLFPALQWKVINNLYGSDHFPVSLKLVDNKQDNTPCPQKFKEEAADWKKFKELSECHYTLIDNLGIDEAAETLTTHIIEAALKSIPQTSSSRVAKPKPWWNDDCRQARKEQNKAWGVLRRCPTTENLVLFKRAKANGRRIRRIAKKESWNRFVSSITSYTDTRKVWRRIKALRGSNTLTYPLVSTSGDTLQDQANALGKHFEYVSSSAHYSNNFLRHKNAEERKIVRDKRQSEVGYNCPFTMQELKVALTTCGKSSPGRDRITYTMIKHLHDDTLEALLLLFNKIWRAGQFPKVWKEAIVVPILKEGKDPSLATSFRPVALTSCLCKVFEKMINRRLIYFLEYHGIIDNRQAGFRSGRSTADHLVAIESYIRDAFVHKQHCLSVFFDLQKAYDTAWRYGILCDLRRLGVCGNMLNSLKDYLSERTFQVRVGNVLSRMFVQENGVPQGGVLSCTLFIVKMNSLGTALPRSISYSLYVDDVHIAFKSCNMSICERQIQLAANKLTKWADENGFCFNPEKSTCVVFSRQRGIRPDPVIKLNETPIAVKKEHKFLGVVLDDKLSFIAHLKRLKVKCLDTVRILKVLSHQSWGTDTKCLLALFNSLVRSRIDYGCLVYQSAARTALKMLDPVYHLGLRLATGAFRTSPVLSLYVEANQWSLETQRKYTGLNYALKVTSLTGHPNSTLGNQAIKLFEKRPAMAEPFLLSVRALAAGLGISFTDAQKTSFADFVPPWDLCPISYDLSFMKIDKRTAPKELIMQHFLFLQNKYRASEFYTDASKSAGAVSCAAHGPNFSTSKTMPEATSIFTAETRGLVLAVEYIIENNVQKSVIFTDSQSAVQALASGKLQKNPVFNQLLKLLCSAHKQKLEITVCWVPGHCGIAGNEQADRNAVTAALRSDLDIQSVPYEDLKAYVRKRLRDQWQEDWNGQTANKLHMVKPKLGRSICEKRDRITEVTLCRLRIGHTHATHAYLLKGTEQPRCLRCGGSLSVIHVLVECKLLEPQRKLHFPELYTRMIPQHPLLFLSDEPLFSTNRVFKYLSDVDFLRYVSYHP